MPHLVPLYEEQEAMRYANYNYSQWKTLDYSEKAMHVAHYRYNRLIKLHGEEAVNSRSERDRKRAELKSKRKK